MFSPETLVISIVSAALVAMFGYIVYMHKRLSKLLLSSKGDNLEQLLGEDRARVIEALKEIQDIHGDIKTLESKFKNTVRATQIVRFNPFETQGSNQSFSTAFLDESGNGLTITSLYGRERINLFAKPITKYSSEYELTEEEKQVIHKSQESHGKN
jgi:hypothetical protein